ncbi:MAG: DNA polymerase III subunit delta [Cohaesibacteraceae bacterium]
MAEIKGQAIDRFINRPDPAKPIILIHGPDRGRVQIRGKALIKTLAGDPPDPMACIDLDPNILDSEPGRIAEEADSVAMFGGNKVVVARMDDPKALVKPVEQLLAQPPQAATVVILAGDLKKSHPLRSRIEKTEAGAAIACYAADRRDVAALLAETRSQFALAISSEAETAVLSLLGADHALSKAEIEKLCLYALKDGTITIDHVEACLTDSAAHSMMDVADFSFAGRTSDALTAMHHALSEGVDASVLGSMLMRHAQQLERMRIDIDRGSSTNSVVSRARPPVFFKRRPHIERALTLWNAAKIRRTIDELDQALVEQRLGPRLGPIRLERQVLRIASEGRRAQGSRA